MTEQIMNKLWRAIRQRIHGSPVLFHMARTVRFAAMVGPTRPLAITASRFFRRSASVPNPPSSLFAGFDPVLAAQQLDREGFSSGLILPPEIVTQLRDQLERSGLSQYVDPHLQWSTAAEIAHDPALMAVARNYLGVEPILHASVLWWSGPTEAIEHQHRFHFDVADFRSMTAFFYLTDVDAQCGPHSIIRGTHQPKRLAECAKIYLSDSEAQRLYGDRIEILTGPSGMGFVEELTAYHRAVPATQNRLMMGITYTLTRKPRAQATLPKAS